MDDRRNALGCPDRPDQITAFCPVYHRAIELIGRRWTGAILRAMLSGATRFSDMATAVPGLSDRLLSERLKELEAEGIVTRTVIPATPVRIEYGLTEKGRALNDVTAAISAWAEEWLTQPDQPLRHPEGVADRVEAVAGHRP
jgi:DNA-binding HxlR family transcriptional regulator